MIDEAVRDYLAGVSLHVIAQRMGISRQKLTAEVKSAIGEAAFRERARLNKRSGNKAKFDPSRVDMKQLVRDWMGGATLIHLRRAYHIPHSRMVAALIRREIGERRYRDGVAERCGRNAKAWMPPPELGNVHSIFTKAWGHVQPTEA